MTPWEQILKTARWAPSLHNAQPWKLELHSEVEATLYVDRRRVTPAIDKTGDFTDAMMGIFLETLAIVATNEDWTLTEELIQSPVSDAPLLPFAKLNLKPGIQRRSLYTNELIHRRKTSRLPHLLQPIPPEASQRLQETAADAGQKLTLIAGEAAEAIVQRHMDALSDDLSNRATHDDMARWFRCSKRQGRIHRDGLDPASLRVPGWRMWLLKTWPGVLRSDFMHRWARSAYRRRLGHVEAIGVLSGPFHGQEAAVKAGRFLFRFWLEAARLDLSLHPLGHLVTNESAAAALKEQLGFDGAWFVFRLGRTALPPTSYRLKEVEILTQPPTA